MTPLPKDEAKAFARELSRTGYRPDRIIASMTPQERAELMARLKEMPDRDAQ